MSTQSPELEKLARRSSISTAPTVIAFPAAPPAEAGEDLQASSPLLPAATHTCMPLAMAALTAMLIACTGELEARDMDITEPVKSRPSAARASCL